MWLILERLSQSRGIWKLVTRTQKIRRAEQLLLTASPGKTAEVGNRHVIPRFSIVPIVWIFFNSAALVRKWMLFSHLLRFHFLWPGGLWEEWSFLWNKEEKETFRQTSQDMPLVSGGTTMMGNEGGIRPVSHLPQRAARSWQQGPVCPELCTVLHRTSLTSLLSGALWADVSPDAESCYPLSSTGPTTPSCSCGAHISGCLNNNYLTNATLKI